MSSPHTTEEFVLDIDGTGVVKHMTFNLVITWDDENTVEKIADKNVPTKKQEGWSAGDLDEKTSSALKKILREEDEEYKGPVIVLQEGIIDWCQATLEHNVYGRCKSLEAGDATGGPELLFGSEGDRAAFILKWL